MNSIEKPPKRSGANRVAVIFLLAPNASAQRQQGSSSPQETKSRF